MNAAVDPIVKAPTHPTRPAHFWHAKLKAAAWHFLICVSIATSVFLLMNQVWYPDGLLTLAGGLRFFTVLVCCDVILGPIITFIVYSIQKSKRERFWDFAVIGVVQVIALSVGLHAIIEGRPAFAVFTGNRIEIINAVHMQKDELALGKEPQFQRVSWQGPVPAIAIFPTTDAAAQNAILNSATQGYGFAYMPRFYQSIQAPQLQVLQQAIKPLSELKQLAPTRQQEIQQAVQAAGLNEQSAGWVDIETNSSFGVAIIERANGKIHTYLGIDA